ncbi:MAG: ABC transporter permease [Phycisphaerales bacterium]
MMRGVWTIASREIAGLFRLPVGWIVVALYAFLSAVVFVQYALIPGVPATMRYFFAAAAWMMVPVAPAISMRVLAEEARSGTIEMLRTSPVGDLTIALGKFLGSWLFLGMTLAPTLLLPITLALVSEPSIDPGPVVTGYLVLIFFGGLCLGIGLVASSLTSSQTLAFLGTLMALVLLLMVSGPIASTLGPRFGEPLRAFSIMARVSELSKGVLDTSAIAFFAIGIIWSVVIAAGVLESRRMSRPRAVTAMLWSGFLIATGACAVLTGVLTTDHAYRIDVTSTGAHKLGPRADRMVELLDGPTELVFAIDRTRADARSPDLVGDVLDAYANASDLITHRSIDLSNKEGIEQTDVLLKDLADRDRPLIERSRETLLSNVSEMQLASEQLSTLAFELDAVRDAIAPDTPGAETNIAFFDQRAGLARLGARTLGEQAIGMQTGLADNSGSIGFPPFDRLSPPALSAWKTQRTQLNDLAEQTRAFAESELATPNVRLLARAAAERSIALRNRAAVAQEQLERLPIIDTLRVARALETGEALLVVGPPGRGISAVDLEALLPSTEILDRAGVSAAGYIGPRAQELVATAIGTLVRPERPIVVFTHGGRSGELLGSSDFFTKVVERFAQRGIDAVEWAAAEELEPPTLDRLDPARARPVVYLVISADSTTGSGEGRLTGAQRAEQLAAAAQRLIDAGEPVLLSLNPSVFPTYGDVDPMAKLAQPFGINARTGTPLLRERVGPGGNLADPNTIAISTANEHPVASATSGLRTALPWAVPIDLSETSDARAWPLITITDNDASSAWAETAWLRLWSTPANARQLLREQPVFDASDRRSESWMLAAAGERTGPLGNARIVVVGSNGWATDSVVASVEQMVDGRITTRFPGNGTLLDTAISWLAGQDELIAPGTDARPVATVKPLSPTQLSSIRWVLLGVVPGVILLAGAGLRGLRG